VWVWNSGFFLSGIISKKINKRLLEKITVGTIVSNEKAKKNLQIDRLPMTSREGLIATFASFAQKNI